MKLKLFLPFILLVILSACSADRDIIDDTAIDDTFVEVTFTIALGENISGTRADETWNDNYDGTEGTSADNNISSLQVYLYDSENNFITKVSQISLNSISTTGTYTYVGTVSTTDLNLANNTFNGKVMVLANCDTYTPSSSQSAQQDISITDAGSLTYTYSSVSSASSIQMWGVVTLTNHKLVPGISSSFGNIDLLRAMAKVQILPSETFTNLGYTINSATLTNYNTSGYCLPTGYADAESTTTISIDDCINIPEDVISSSESLAFSSDDDSYYIYVPEYYNIGEGNTTST
ncbi:MAG: hypothetical protein Q4D41_00855, partial [Prevotellaceae bacterium]|nr:hypothetical protein [Prevotellaceae bacterium]